MGDTAWILIHYGFVGNRKNRRLAWLSLTRHNGIRPIGHHFWRIRPGTAVNLLDQMVSHQPEALMEEAQPFSELAETIRDQLQGARLVAMDGREATHLLRAHFDQAGIRWRASVHAIDPFLEQAGMEAGPLAKGHLRAACRANGLPVLQEQREEDAGPAMLLNLWQTARNRLSGETLDHLRKTEARRGAIPRAIDHKALHQLPNRCGIYYLLDANHRILYVGKSNRIYDRVRSHLANDQPDSPGYHLRRQVFTFRHTETGSELVALLLESSEIKRYMPPYNRALRRKKKRYALHYDAEGDYYEIALRQPERPGLKEFASRDGVLSFLQRRLRQLGLDAQSVRLEPNYRIYRQKEVDPALWRPEVLVTEPPFPWDHFYILGPGRQEGERSLVCIQKQAFAGFGFAEASALEAQAPVHWKPFIRSRPDDEDQRAIIRQWLRKNKGEDVVLQKELDEHPETFRGERSEVIAMTASEARGCP